MAPRLRAEPLRQRIQYAFVAGEVSPTLFGRTDLEKYDLGLAKALNWFIDYRGGLTTRPGTRFLDWLPDEAKLFKFQFAPNVFNTYLLVFGDQYVRIMQDGAYLVEADVAVSSVSAASPAVVTTGAAHGYTTGDWVKLTGFTGDLTILNNRTFEVTVLSPTTFSIAQAGFGTAVDTTGLSSSTGTVNRVYTLTTPYTQADLADLRAYQIRDYVRLTHPNYQTRNLVRTSATAWSLGTESVGTSQAAPTGLSGTASGAGSASVVYAVTAISANGEESQESTRLHLTSIVNFTTTAGTVSLSWTASAGADRYNIYRSIVSNAALTAADQQLGYIGTAYGPSFVDNNIVPDFTASPPEFYDPFASSNYPGVSTIFQQRQIYAGSYDQPLTVWGSRPGFYSNFDVSPVTVDNDAYEFDIDSPLVSRILHVEPMRGGLLLLSKGGVWQLSAPESGGAVTPTDALADPQSWAGASDVPPIRIGTDLLYIEDRTSVVQLLQYNQISRVYTTQDVSILSTHLFPSGKRIRRWDYASAPYNLVWGVREDGTLVSFTLVREQNVYAWTPHQTRGLFYDVCTLQGADRDEVYFVVKRKINGAWVWMLEVLENRELTHVEEAWCVDAGLSTSYTYPAATVTPSATSGTITLTASASVFSAGDVGKVYRGGGGKGTVTGYTSGTQVSVKLVRDITAVIPETEIPVDLAEGEWALDAPFSSVTGLWHLEGEEVAILADGNVKPNATVTNGTVSLSSPATKVTVGLPFQCVAQTLPPTSATEIIEGKRKNIIGSAVRVHDSRGLKVGSSLDKLYEMKERTVELYGEPVELQRSNKYILIAADWDENGQTYYVQDYPLPASVLGLVTDLDVGDDPR